MTPPQQKVSAEHSAPSAGAEHRWTRGPAKAGGRAAKSPVLTIEVMVGIPAESRVFAPHPLIIRGVRQRAEVEMRERPEVGEIRVVVHHRPPAGFHPESERRRPASTALHRRGTILVYPYRESAVELLARQTTVVAVLEDYGPLGIDFIDTNDTAGITALVGQLHAAGHVQVGFLSWNYPIAGHWVDRRYRAFAAAMQARGMRFRPEWVLNVLEGQPRLTPPEVDAAAAELVRSAGVTAWVCAADHQAYHLLASLAAEGLRVPRDCSVTGFDGVPPPPGLLPVASMRVPHEHIGSSALTRMLNRILYPSSPQRKIFVEPQLVPGETIAAPPLA
jgi:LacI family transcriptional regulator